MRDGCPRCTRLSPRAWRWTDVLGPAGGKADAVSTRVEVDRRSDAQSKPWGWTKCFPHDGRRGNEPT